MTKTAPRTPSLLALARDVVAALDDAEINHGGLISRETLVKIGALRLELASWPERWEESGNFPLVDQLLEAKSDSALAALLLVVPDGLVLSHGLELEAACYAMRFEAGVLFLAERAVALHAVRDAHGLMPQAMAAELEARRVAMSRLAAGGGD